MSSSFSWKCLKLILSESKHFLWNKFDAFFPVKNSLSGAYSYIALIKHVWDCPKEWIQLDEDGFLNLPEHKAGEPDPDSPAYFVNARFLDLWFIMIFWFVMFSVFICFPVLQISWHYFNIFIALCKARCWHHVHLQPSKPCLQGKIFSLWYVSWLCSMSSQMQSLSLSEWPRYKNWIAAALFDGESAVVFCLATRPRHALCMSAGKLLLSSGQTACRCVSRVGWLREEFQVEMAAISVFVVVLRKWIQSCYKKKKDLSSQSVWQSLLVCQGKRHGAYGCSLYTASWINRWLELKKRWKKHDFETRYVQTCKVSLHQRIYRRTARGHGDGKLVQSPSNQCLKSPGAQKRNCASGAIQLSRADVLFVPNRPNCRSSNDQRCLLGSSLLKRAAQGFSITWENHESWRLSSDWTIDETHQVFLGRFGWDCHGLPVEYEIDKKLNIKVRKILGFQYLKFQSSFSFAAATVISYGYFIISSGPPRCDEAGHCQVQRGMPRNCVALRSTCQFVFWLVTKAEVFFKETFGRWDCWCTLDVPTWWPLPLHHRYGSQILACQKKNKSLSSVDPWAVECLQVCVRFNDSLQNGGVLLNDLGT